MKKHEQLYAEAGQRARLASEREAAEDAWGLFTAQLGGTDDRQGFFLWFPSRAELLDYLPFHAVFWACADDPGPETESAAREARAHVKDYLGGRAGDDDLLFRLNNLLAPGGMELLWMGAFSELLDAAGEIPRRTRLFCRRTLADMEEPGINPLSDAPIPPRYLRVFIACLRDFGLEGQGLDNPLLP